MKNQSTRTVSLLRLLALALSLILVAAACGGSDDSGDTSAASADSAEAEAESTEAETSADTDTADAGADTATEPDTASDSDSAAATEPGGGDCPTITLVTHDSFAISEGVLESFTAQTCIVVELLEGGDAGQMVSAAILTKDNPTADVMYGIDNTFLQRGLDNDLFLPYSSISLEVLDFDLLLDPEFRVTPINFGDVCANYWIDALPGDAPTTLDDLIDPVNQGQFVTSNPETSSPGLAFLLATIARYGEDGWQDYWQALVDNDVSITPGWSDAYYGEFTAGGGERSIVMSYASSPPAEVIFADPPIDTPPTGVLLDSCFRQVEFAGILNGTTEIEAAGQLIDFMTDIEFQEDIPLNMFVYPANTTASLPAEFVEFGQLSDDPLTLSPAEIEAGRQAWTERWVEIVLG